MSSDFFRPKMTFFRNEVVVKPGLDFGTSREFSGRGWTVAKHEVERFVVARIVGSRLRWCGILNISDISLTVHLKKSTSPRQKIGRRREEKIFDPTLFLRSTLFSWYRCGNRFFFILPKTQIIVKFSKIPKKKGAGEIFKKNECVPFF